MIFQNITLSHQNIKFLYKNVFSVVESYLAHDKDGHLITGEGSLLENAAGISYRNVTICTIVSTF